MIDEVLLFLCKLKQTSGIIPYLHQLVYVKLKSDWASWRYRDYNSSKSDVSAFIFFLLFCFYCFVLVRSGLVSWWQSSYRIISVQNMGPAWLN